MCTPGPICPPNGWLASPKWSTTSTPIWSSSPATRWIDDHPMPSSSSAGSPGSSAPLGVYGILGNHDHYFDPRISEQALAEAGITPLVNDSRLLRRGDAGLAVIGLEDLNAGPGRAPDFSLLGRFPDAFRLVLSHQPRTWHDAVSGGAHLDAGRAHPRRSDRPDQPQPQRRPIPGPLHFRALPTKQCDPLRLARNRRRRGSPAARIPARDRHPGPPAQSASGRARGLSLPGRPDTH